LAKIPSEIPDRIIEMVLKKCGKVKGIQAETWSRIYRYPVENGIKAATVALVEHIPSHLVVAGHRSLVCYDGQPPTCYGCNETGHIYMECPKRRRVEVAGGEGRSQSWADVAARGRMQQAGGEQFSGGVYEVKRSSEEPRTNDNERDVEEQEEIMELQEMEEMMSEEVSRAEYEGKSTERKGMEPTRENKKAEGGHGGDTRKDGNQEEWEQQGMIQKEMEDSTRRIRDSSRNKDGNERKSDVMWSVDGDMEIGYDLEGGNAYSPTIQENAHGEAVGEAPATYEEQDKYATVQDGIRDKNQRSVYAGRRGMVQSS
jgi:hypothetical protein